MLLYNDITKPFGTVTYEIEISIYADLVHSMVELQKWLFHLHIIIRKIETITL